MPRETPKARVIRRALRLIRERHGSVADLPASFAQVIWVTTFRASEVALRVEDGGGVSGLMKSVLLNGGGDTQELEKRTRQLELLNKIVPIIRAAKPRDRAADVQLMTDILKYGMPATEMSILRRVWARCLTKADPMYKEVIPPELQK